MTPVNEVAILLLATFYLEMVEAGGALHYGRSVHIEQWGATEGP
ncbi:MAG: hypothetical protein QN152_06580 [Armatimonadota bacterium]|nr:hypothetical protein [Armatimonadota bacterium]MDR7426125.1 hypothetical protein [Armatimonadota bacterium]MDR7463519.1 hypothetical protein [Armatimonadota bacterium]MDR7469124.1 hypothetical protein [Armatimonadota bacterium]MDR7475348.1 hypothetical protein [Armatimonadota bacterium]